MNQLHGGTYIPIIGVLLVFMKTAISVAISWIVDLIILGVLMLFTGVKVIALARGALADIITKFTIAKQFLSTELMRQPATLLTAGKNITFKKD